MYPRIYLAINNCVLYKRWTRPDEWGRIIRDMGIYYIEASADNELDPLYTGEEHLRRWVDEVRAFPPGSYYYDGKFVKYEDIAAVHGYVHEDIDVITKNIHDKLTEGVKKRLDADAPLGFLLSGGLDSSLVCAIAADILKKPIRTFAIGMDTDAIDLKYAKEVADFIGAEHTEVIMTKEEVLESLETVIEAQPMTSRRSVRAWACTLSARQSMKKQT